MRATSESDGAALRRKYIFWWLVCERLAAMVGGRQAICWTMFNHTRTTRLRPANIAQTQNRTLKILILDSTGTHIFPFIWASVNVWAQQSSNCQERMHIIHKINITSKLVPHQCRQTDLNTLRMSLANTHIHLKVSTRMQTKCKGRFRHIVYVAVVWDNPPNAECKPICTHTQFRYSIDLYNIPKFYAGSLAGRLKYMLVIWF